MGVFLALKALPGLFARLGRSLLPQCRICQTICLNIRLCICLFCMASLFASTDVRKSSSLTFLSVDIHNSFAPSVYISLGEISSATTFLPNLLRHSTLSARCYAHGGPRLFLVVRQLLRRPADLHSSGAQLEPEYPWCSLRQSQITLHLNANSMDSHRPHDSYSTDSDGVESPDASETEVCHLSNFPIRWIVSLQGDTGLKVEEGLIYSLVGLSFQASFSIATLSTIVMI